MAVIYIKEQGAYVRKEDRRLLVEKNSVTLAEIPIVNVSNVAVMGNVQLTTQALHMLMYEGVDVIFFSYAGNYLGQISADSSKNIFLRFAQYECYMDIDRRLMLARTIVKNKIINQINVIKNHNWREIEYDYHDELVQLNKNLISLPEKQTANEIMGVEGICSSIYFTSFGHMFRGNIRFEGRNRRPPKDPINVILSLAYTLLTKEIASVLDAESFETYLGFLHGIRYGRKSLALDVVEEFRQPVVDRLVVILFNKHIITEDDFSQSDEGILLTEEGFKKFCGEYEKWMKRPVSEKDNRNFRAIIKNQVSNLKKAIREGRDYFPYEWGDCDVSGKL